MTRIPLQPYDEWDTDALGVMAPGRKLPESNVLSLLARHPDLARAFLTFNTHMLTRSNTVPPRIRELVILRVAWRRRCRYEWVQHLLIAPRAGVTEDEIAGIRKGEPTLLTRMVDELDGNSDLSDETYGALAAEFSERQLMDLVFLVGAYASIALAMNAFRLELDPGLADDPEFPDHT